MKITRSTSAMRMPNVNTFCWYFSGTAKVLIEGVAGNVAW